MARKLPDIRSQKLDSAHNLKGRIDYGYRERRNTIKCPVHGYLVTTGCLNCEARYKQYSGMVKETRGIHGRLSIAGANGRLL
jgi:hypothetical protein